VTELWGTLLADGPLRTVLLTRDYAAPPEAVWDAVTSPERIARWLGPVQVTGDEYVLQMRPDAPIVTGKIVECTAPQRLLVGWNFRGEPASEVELRVEPTATGSTLTLQQTQVEAIEAGSRGAGWQVYLGRLADALGESVEPQDFDSLKASYRTMEASLVAGAVGTEANGWTVRLERLLDAEPAQVWSALTEPDRIGRWLWPVVEWPDDPARSRALELGDRFVLGDSNAPDGQTVFEVLAMDEGRQMVVSWGDTGAHVTFEVEPTSGGTVLRLRQSPAPEVFAAGRMRSGPDFGAGWHSLVDGLVLLLQRHDPREEPANDELWQAAYAVYQT
jgi:uncharacterized protein YndB with AHSA1/START domain